MKLYPFEVPENVHPNIWWVLGFGLTPDQANGITRHLSEDLGFRLVDGHIEVTYSWVIDVAGDYPDRERAKVGDRIDRVVAEQGAVRITGGAPPPGVRLEKHSGKLVGTLTHPGLYSVTVTTGPAVKYDPLGSPGGPNDPGMWIPVDQPRQASTARLNNIPVSIADLSDRDKDHALAELMAWSDGVTIKEADRGD